MITRNIFWKCPNCSLPLILNRTGYTCGNGHSFDRAKQGYCNFLLPNQKNSKDPGDDKEMIDARRKHLENGYYDFLLDEIITVVTQFANDERAGTSETSILDLGCGEGYYLNKLYKALETDAKLVTAKGIDISKVANRRAAVHYKNIEFAVASTYSIPVLAESVDVALSVFSPYSEQELARVLKKRGVFIKVSPGERHLYQIKERLYERVSLHEPPMVPEPFTLISETKVSQTLQFSQAEDIKNLLAMTPLNWRGCSDAKERLIADDALAVEADFIIQVMSLQEA